MRAVAFDLDGLMFNTEAIYTRVAEVLLARRGQALDMTLIMRMMGRPARVALPMMIAHHRLSDSVPQLAAETEVLFHELLPTELQPMPGLFPLLQMLDEQRIPKAIATSSGRAYVQQVLTLAQLPTDFEFLLTAEDVQEGKPHPEIYLKAAQRFNVAPTEMLVLEDSENGCRAAVAAAAVTVAVAGPHYQECQYPGVAFRAASLADPRIDQLVRRTGP